MVKLADLPEELREQFGYDPAKAQTAEEAAREKRAQTQQRIDAQALAAQQAQNSQPTDGGLSLPLSSYFGEAAGSGGGRVFVRGYTRANGTYVGAYTRSR